MERWRLQVRVCPTQSQANLLIMHSFYIAIMVYTFKLDLTQDDLDTVEHVTKPGMLLTTLGNDLYSFKREAVLDLQTGGNFNNAVWRLMEKRDITAKEAKDALLNEKMAPLEQQFIDAKSAFLASGNQSPDLIYLVEQVEFMVSGNWYWGCTADRYHRWRENVVLFGEVDAANLNMFILDEAEAKYSDYLHQASLGEASESPIEQQCLTPDSGRSKIDQAIPTALSVPGIPLTDEVRNNLGTLSEGSQLTNL